jgi:hypothetical protein
LDAPAKQVLGVVCEHNPVRYVPEEQDDTHVEQAELAYREQAVLAYEPREHSLQGLQTRREIVVGEMDSNST